MAFRSRRALLAPVLGSRTFRHLVIALLPVTALVACGSDEASPPSPANAAGASGLGSAGLGGSGTAGTSGGTAGATAGAAGKGGAAGTGAAGGGMTGGAAGTDTTGFGGSSNSGGSAGIAGKPGAAGAAGATGTSGSAGAASQAGTSGSAGQDAGGSAGAFAGGAGTAGSIGDAGASGAGASGGSGASGGAAGSDGAGGFGALGGAAGAGGGATTYPACTGATKKCGDSLAPTVDKVCETSGKVGVVGAVDCAFLDSKAGSIDAIDELNRSWGQLRAADIVDEKATITPPAGAPGPHEIVLLYASSGSLCELARFPAIETRPSPDVAIDRPSGSFVAAGTGVDLTAGSSQPIATYAWTYPLGGSGAPVGQETTFDVGKPEWKPGGSPSEWTRAAMVTATAANGCTATASYEAIVFGCGAETVAAGGEVVLPGMTKVVGTVDQKVSGVVVCATAKATAGPFVGNLDSGGFRERVFVGPDATFTIPSAHTGRVLVFAGKGATVKIDGTGRYAVVAASGPSAPTITGSAPFQRVDCNGYTPPTPADFGGEVPAGCL